MPLTGRSRSWLGPVIGAVITGMPAWRRARLGLSRSFQIARPGMTILENLLVSTTCLSRPSRLFRLRAFFIGVAGRKRVHARLRRAMPGDDARMIGNGHNRCIAQTWRDVIRKSASNEFCLRTTG
jgi:hypothetical protein